MFHCRDCCCFGRKRAPSPSSSSKLQSQSNVKPSNCPGSTNHTPLILPASNPVSSTGPTSLPLHTISTAPPVNNVPTTKSVFGAGASCSVTVNPSSASAPVPSLLSALTLPVPGLQVRFPRPFPHRQIFILFEQQTKIHWIVLYRPLKHHRHPSRPYSPTSTTSPPRSGVPSPILTNSPLNLLAQIQKPDDNHKQGSISRHDTVKNILEIMKQGLGSLSAVVAGDSGPVSLVPGAVKIVVEVCLLPLTSNFHSSEHSAASGSSPYALSPSLHG